MPPVHASTSRSRAETAVTTEQRQLRARRIARIALAAQPALALLLAVTAPAQTVLFGSAVPSVLTPMPWDMTSGTTSLHVYSASTLRAWGVCAGAQLTDFAVPSGTTGSGTFLAPQCTLAIGHLSVQPPVPGAWTSHLDTPAIVHGTASGPFSFAWSQGAWNSLPGVAAAGFVWDGARDVGVLVSTAPGTTGGFLTGTSAGVRHHAPVFAATSQTPTVLNSQAMAARLTFAPGGPCATKALVGTGCYDGAYTFYEQFANVGTFDLQGSAASPRTLLATPVPSGFQLADAPSAWYAPTGSPVLNNSAVPGPMQNDSISRPLVLPFAFGFPGGSTSVLHAAADGFVWLGATTAATSTVAPNTGALISQLPRLAPFWCRLDPTINLTTHPGSGIYFDIDPSNQAVYVTWREVGVRTPVTPPGQTSVSVQCVLRANGSFEWRYGAIAPAPQLSLAGPMLVGWSQGTAQGGSARALGPIDISARLPFQTSGPDSWRLLLDANLPILGTSLVLTVSNVQNVAPIAFLVFGDALIPPLHLAFVGAPDCFAYTNANLPSLSLPVTFAGGSIGTGSTSITLPNLPGLLGLPLNSQALALTFNNALNVATSNGLAMQLGR